MCNCIFDSDVSTGDIKFVLETLHVYRRARVIARVSGHGLLSDVVFTSKLFHPYCLLCLADRYASNVLNTFNSLVSRFEWQFTLTISTKFLRYLLWLIIVSAKHTLGSLLLFLSNTIIFVSIRVLCDSSLLAENILFQRVIFMTYIFLYFISTFLQ